MKKHLRKYIKCILAGAVAAVAGLLPQANAQTSVTQMENNDTVFLDACALGGGVIYDDGGATGDYSNYFNGWVIINASPGVDIMVSGSYSTESCCDNITIWDGSVQIGETLAGNGSVAVSGHSGQLTIMFHSDGSVIDAGFALTWSTSMTGGGCSNSILTLDTANVTSTSAVISWTATDATGPFRVIYNGLVDSGITATSYTLNGLSPNTQYTVSVVPDVAPINYCCGNSISFRTECGLTQLPYSEGFEGIEEGGFPNCWIMSVNFDNNNYIPHVDAAHHSEGYRSLMLSCGGNDASGHFGMVATPPFDGTGTHAIHISIMASHSSTPVLVGLCNETGSDYDNYGFTPITTLYVSSYWQTYFVEWTATVPGQRLAFRMLQSMQGGISGRMVYLDNMVSESCGVDLVSTSHVEPTQLQLTWTTFGNPQCSVGIRPEGWVADSAVIPNATSPLTVTGLSPERTYTLTVYPVCGTVPSVGHGTEVTTLPLPVTSSGFCSNFAYDGYLPPYWRSYYQNGYYHTITNSMTGLAGKTVAVQYTTNRNTTLYLGTMTYADDATSFTTAQTANTVGDNHPHTAIFTIPATATGNHLAIRVGTSNVNIDAIEIGDTCLMGQTRIVHRRGSTVQLAWDVVYDTVIVQHGYSDFIIGSGTLDTFYNASQCTIQGLSPNTTYDFYVYRSCGQPCVDRRVRLTTAYNDYPLPYCENFSTYNNYSMWDYSDWLRPIMRNGTPQWTPYYYDNNIYGAIEMASWGPGYSSMVLLPDVEVDSHTVLNFYIHDNSPQSVISIGAIPEGYSNGYYQQLDTIHVTAQGQRHHVTYAFRPSDTLFSGRIAIQYYHLNDYEFYRCQIDEINIGHTAYGTLQRIYLSHDSVAFSLTGLVGTDSVMVTLVSNSDTHSVMLDTSQLAAFGLGGLQSGVEYLCYVQPIHGGCSSYALSFVTRTNGGGGGGGGGGGIYYNDCFSMDDVLSYELPFHWAASGNTLVTTDDWLQIDPSVAVAMHPMGSIGGLTFSFDAHTATPGGTLIIGSVPSASISTDSVHFTFSSADFTPIDTIALDTAWLNYHTRLPYSGMTNRRLCFLAGSQTVGIDKIGINSCPIVNFTAEGNVIIATIEDGMYSNYYLTIDDSAGTVHRVLFIDESPFRIEGLLLGNSYTMSWHCTNTEEECQPSAIVRTANSIPLPQCIDFTDVDNATIPTTWTYIKSNPSALLRINTSPALQMTNNNSQWSYLVLPSVIADSTWSAYVNFRGYSVQIGVMDSETNTASFLPLYSTTSSSNQYYNIPIDLNAHVGKHLVFRTSGNFELYSLHMYEVPLVTYKLVHAHQLQANASNDHPYWLNVYGNMQYVTENPHTLQVNNSYTYINQAVDSTGYFCESSKYCQLGSLISMPFCWQAEYSFYNSARFRTYYNSTGDVFYNGHEFLRMYQGTWQVLNEVDVDSLKHIGISITYHTTTPSDTLVVGAMTDAYDTLTFIAIDTVVYTRTDDSLQTVYVDFSSYSDTGRWVAFHHLPRPSSGYFDINSFFMEPCVGASSAKASLVRWNQVKITADTVPFFMEYYKEGSSEHQIVRVDSVPMTLILEPEKMYQFKFRCDSLDDNCRAAQRVKTLAVPIMVPDCIDFDTLAVGEMPKSWIRRNNAICVSNIQAHSGTNSLKIPIGTNSYAITTDVNIDTINKIAASLWFRVDDLADRLVVGVMSNPYDMNTFHPISTLAPMEAGVWQKGFVDFSNAPDDAHFIVLRARSNRQADERSIYVDDLHVSDCAAFNLHVQSLQSGSIDLAWNQIGNPDITVTVEDNGIPAGIYSHVSTPLHIEPLSLQHYYTFRLTSVCDSSTDYCTTNYTDSVSVVSPAPSSGCVNPTDMTSPQSVFFSGTYDNPYDNAGAINYGSLHPDSRHTVCYDTAQRDPRTGNQLRTIPEGYTSSVRLGNWSTNAFEPEAEGIIYSLFVDTTSFELLLLRYAAVLQDPLHALSDQPRFRMELLDTNYNIIDSACTSADFIADQSLGWHIANDGVLWKDWTAVGVDLSNHAGEQVYFRLTTYDCNEGSHYGYAYFTLECMRKNMNTIACGDVDSNTLSAPEGFNYRWYTNLSSTTISNAQKITVPSEDVTYFCEVSKLDNPSCNFTISAYGGTRYPMASFDTSITIDSCVFYVTFTNTSGISNDGVTLLPGEQCETALWDFGNGITSTATHGYAVYTQPGTYTVSLVSGIAYDKCQDTAYMTLVLAIPPDMPPADTINASICDNEYYSFFGQNYNTADTIYHHVIVPGQTCDSIYVLQLNIRSTSLYDTFAVVCDSFFWRGSTYTVDGIYMSGIVGPNIVGCDSTVRLNLTVNYSANTNDSIYICPGYPFMYEGIDYGGPITLDVLHSTIHNCDSMVHVVLMPRDSTYRLYTLYSRDSIEWLNADTIVLGCSPDTLFLLDTTPGAAYYSWTLQIYDTTLYDTLNSLSVPFPTPNFMLPVPNRYTLIVTDTLGCHDTVSQPIYIFRYPTSDFDWNPSLPAITKPEVQFSNHVVPIDSCSFLWNIQREAGGSFDTTSVRHPFYHWGTSQDNMEGDYEVELIAYWPQYTPDSTVWFTCIDTARHMVTITNDFLQFPNLVTPNGDGINDIWRIVNLIEYGNYPINELWIFNQWGVEVYHVRNIDEESEFWDPNVTSSPDGTYYYRFTARSAYGIVKRNGIIEVLRSK